MARQPNTSRILSTSCHPPGARGAAPHVLQAHSTPDQSAAPNASAQGCSGQPPGSAPPAPCGAAIVFKRRPRCQRWDRPTSAPRPCIPSRPCLPSRSNLMRVSINIFKHRTVLLDWPSRGGARQPIHGARYTTACCIRLHERNTERLPAEIDTATRAHRRNGVREC